MNENDALQDPLPQPLDEEPTEENDSPDLPVCDGESEAEPLLPPVQEDPSPDPSSPPTPTEEGDPLGDLRRELDLLKEGLLAQAAQDARIAAEREEFRSLYPQIPLSALPDSVWEDVRRGIPLAAAYALCERRRAQTDAVAAQSNRINRARSAGRINSDTSDFFTPSEVRAMSSDEVRRNYSAILRSMREWH